MRHEKLEEQFSFQEVLRLEKLSTIERKTYDFIENAGEIQTRNLPDKRMIGAVSSLKDKELVEIYKRYTGIFRRKRKKKFVRVKNV